MCGDGDMMEGVSLRGRQPRRPPSSSPTSSGSTTATRSPSRAQPTSPSAKTSAARFARLRLARPPCRRRQRHRTPSPPPCATRKPCKDRPTFILVHSIIGYGAPKKQGHPRSPRRAPRRRGDQAPPRRFYGWPEDAQIPRPGRRPRELRPAQMGARSSHPPPRLDGHARQIPRAVPGSRGANSTMMDHHQLPEGWDKPTSPPSQPTPRASRRATARRKSSTPSARTSPGSSAAPPTSPPAPSPT